MPSSPGTCSDSGLTACTRPAPCAIFAVFSGSISGPSPAIPRLCRAAESASAAGATQSKSTVSATHEALSHTTKRELPLPTTFLAKGLNKTPTVADREVPRGLFRERGGSCRSMQSRCPLRRRPCSRNSPALPVHNAQRHPAQALHHLTQPIVSPSALRPRPQVLPRQQPPPAIPHPRPQAALPPAATPIWPRALWTTSVASSIRSMAKATQPRSPVQAENTRPQYPGWAQSANHRRLPSKPPSVSASAH